MKIVSWMWFLSPICQLLSSHYQEGPSLSYRASAQTIQMDKFTARKKKNSSLYCCNIFGYKEQHGEILSSGASFFKKKLFLGMYTELSMRIFGYDSSKLFQTGIKFSWILHILSIWVWTSVQGLGLYFIYLCTPRS